MLRAEGCDPCRGRNLPVPVTGGVALLNPRLMAGIPPGWLRAITMRRTTPDCAFANPEGSKPFAGSRRTEDTHGKRRRTKRNGL